MTALERSELILRANHCLALAQRATRWQKYARARRLALEARRLIDRARETERAGTAPEPRT